MYDKVIVQPAYKNKEGDDILVTSHILKLLSAVANRPPEQKSDERLLSYNFQFDSNLANVWTPYEFWLNDQFSHCGVNSFQLFNKAGKWEIIYIIDTRRRQDCQ